MGRAMKRKEASDAVERSAAGVNVKAAPVDSGSDSYSDSEDDSALDLAIDSGSESESERSEDGRGLFAMFQQRIL